MKKRQLALISGILFSLLAVLGCSNAAGDSGSGSGSDSSKVTVTFDAGTIGRVYDSKKSEYCSTTTITIGKGTVCEPPELKINYFPEDYVYEFSCYYKSGTEVAFDFTKPINEDTLLVAQYKMLKPTELIAVTSDDGKDLTVTFKHKGFGMIIDNYTFEIKLLCDGTVIATKTGDLKTVKEVTFKDLPLGKKIDVEFKSKYNNEESEVTRAVAYTSLKTEVLMLMYMDGDNNLNDSIFADLNEAEYGLSKVNAETRDKIKVLVLWDGLTKEGTIYDDTLVKPEYGSENAMLLKLGADDSLNYELSDNTEVLSSEVSWLSTNEVDMGSKETLKNFLIYALSNYKSDNIILQFSNHGGGPRSYKPGYSALKPTKVKNLGSVSRSMCWDVSAGEKTFIKTSDVSEVLEEVGFNKNNKISIILEDVCLGGSIEEAYELMNYTDYFLASPNNIPANGFDYTVAMEDIGNLVGGYTFQAKSFGKAIGKKYAEDYGIFSKWTDTDFENYIADPESGITLDTEGMTAAEITAMKNQIKASLSMYTTAMCTISLIETKWLDDIVTKLNAIVDEIVATGDTQCYHLYYDDEQKSLTTEKNANCITITRAQAFMIYCMDPNYPISYQGSFSWLFDLGYMLDKLYKIAYDESWSKLMSLINTTMGYMINSEAIPFSWRDGVCVPTYTTEYGLGGGTYDAGNTYGWLGGTKITYLHYGLTISGNAHAVDNDGNYVWAYPEWYSDMKFGKDCKWNQLLQAIFSE